MNRLPPEVLYPICSLLEKVEDIKTFRLLSTPCAAIGLEYLFSVLQFNYLPESLERAQKVLQHPDICKHVRQLFFEPALLPQYHDFDEYKESVRCTRWSDAFRLDSYHPNETEQQEGWNLYKDSFRTQTKMYKASQGLGVIEAALKRLSNLRAVRVSTYKMMWDKADMKLNRGFRKYLVGPKDSRSLDEPDYVVISLLRGVVALDRKLEELYIGNTSWRLLQAPEVAWKNFLKVARNLKVLKLSLVFCRNHENYGASIDSQVDACDNWRDEQERDGSDRLSDLLDCASNLEVFFLGFDIQHRGHDGSRQLGWLSPCLISHPPTNLRELSLEFIETDQSSIEQMLRSCAASLRSLDLAFVHIREAGGWTTIIPQLPRILKLHNIQLGMCLSEGFGSEEVTFEFRGSPYEKCQHHETGREIQSLILRREEIHLEETGEEIRTLMKRLRAEMDEKEEEDEERMEEIMAQFGGGYEAEWDDDEDDEDEDDDDEEDEDEDDDEDEWEDTDEEDTEPEPERPLAR